MVWETKIGGEDDQPEQRELTRDSKRSTTFTNLLLRPLFSTQSDYLNFNAKTLIVFNVKTKIHSSWH